MAEQTYLAPIDQLYELNSEIYDIADTFPSPLIVVGGQAVNYWLNFFNITESLSNEELLTATSVDIDYCGKKDVFKACASSWDVKFNIPDINSATPEIGNSVLKNAITDEIKSSDGALFIDISDLAEHNTLSPNIVDFLPVPAGFKKLDFEHSRLIQHTSMFKFPSAFNHTSHPNLRILNPIGCLKSRMLNLKILKRVKDPKVEVARIKLLIIPIGYFLQLSLIQHGYRPTRKYIKLLMILTKSKQGINLRIIHGVDLSIILLNLVENHKDHLPNGFCDTEFPDWIKSVDEKYSRLLHLKLNQTHFPKK